MAYEIGFVDNTGSEGVAHWQMLLKIKALAESNGWTTLRYLNPTPYTDNTVIRELILKGAGLSGTEEIYVGFRTYQNQSADYYNMSLASFTGYVPGNVFTEQPGYYESGMCAHNQRIDYWLVINAQRVVLAMKVGTPTYEVGYVGKFLPYGTPSQYPYPVAVMGTLAGLAATRFSDTSSTHTSGIKGSRADRFQTLPNGALRDVLGVWNRFVNRPFETDGGTNVSGAIRRDTGGSYKAMPCVLYNSNQVWGELEGVRYISGFNNATENTAVLNGKNQVVIQDGFRTGIADYFLLELS